MSEEQSKYAVKRHDGQISEPDPEAEVFEVVGAGFISFLTTTTARCGTAVGISVDTSWNKHGYCGGVMDVAEVFRLRDSLDQWIECHAKIKKEPAQ